MEKFLVGPVMGGGFDPSRGVGKDRVSHVLPFSVEVRDSLLLLLLVGLCVGLVYAVIVGIYRGTGVYMVPCSIVPFCERNV
jgi:hypothetical protein